MRTITADIARHIATAAIAALVGASVANAAAGESNRDAKQARALERIADALEKGANCACKSR